MFIYLYDVYLITTGITGHEVQYTMKSRHMQARLTLCGFKA